MVMRNPIKRCVEHQEARSRLWGVFFDMNERMLGLDGGKFFVEKSYFNKKELLNMKKYIKDNTSKIRSLMRWKTISIGKDIIYTK